MVQVIALVICFTGMQCLPVASLDVSGGNPPTASDQGQAQAEDSVSAPGLRIVRVIEVTDGSAAYMQPIWSPDGKKLAFAKSGFTGIYVCNVDGSGPIRQFASGGSLRCLPFWTPNSKALLCEVGTGSMARLGQIDVETAEVDTLAGPLADGGHLHRNSYGDVTFTVRREMQSLDFETGSMKTTQYAEVKFLDPQTGSIESMCDYYSKERPLSGDVQLKEDFRARKMWVVRDGGATRTEFPHEVLLASLSPMRDRVAFLQGDGNIYVSRLDGSGMVNVGYGCREAWSPDGKRLVYLGAIEEDEWNVTAAELFVANVDGSRVTQLTHTPDQVKDYPVWSPDGMRIAYLTDNTRKIYVAVLEEVK